MAATNPHCPLPPPPSFHQQVFTVEMHHKRVEKAGPGDNVGMNIKGLDKVRSECCAAVLCFSAVLRLLCSLPRQHPFCTLCACRLHTQLPCSPCPTPIPSHRATCPAPAMS